MMTFSGSIVRELAAGRGKLVGGALRNLQETGEAVSECS